MWEISRAVTPGKNLTLKQRSSSLFAEEPRIGAIILRRGSRPLVFSDERYEMNKARITHLLSSGSIVVRFIDTEKLLDTTKEIVPEVNAPIDNKDTTEVIAASAELPVETTSKVPSEEPVEPTQEASATEAVETPIETPVEVPAPVVPTIPEQDSRRGRKKKG